MERTAIGPLVLFENMVMAVIAIVIVYELWRIGLHGLYRFLQCRTSCAMGWAHVGFLNCGHLESLGGFRLEHLSPAKTDSPQSGVFIDRRYLYYIYRDKEVIFITALHGFPCRIVVVSVFSPDILL